MSPEPRLFARGTFVGFRRNKVNQKMASALVTIEGVGDTTDARWYLGKRVAYVYRAKKKGTEKREFRYIWGRVQATHGNSGVVRCKFRNNLPARAMGAQIRVMLFPSNL